MKVLVLNLYQGRGRNCIDKKEFLDVEGTCLTKKVIYDILVKSKVACIVDATLKEGTDDYKEMQQYVNDLIEGDDTTINIQGDVVIQLDEGIVFLIPVPFT